MKPYRFRSLITIIVSMFSMTSAGICLPHFSLSGIELPPADRIVSVGSNSELDNAIQNAQPGDRIVIADGNYDGINLVGLKGTQDKPIVFTAKNARRAIISGSTKGRNARLSDCAYLEFHGLRFTGASTWGFTMGPAYSSDDTSLGCHNIRIIGCEIDGAGQLLLKVNGNSSYIDIIGNILHDSGMSGFDKPYAEGIYIGDGGDMDDRSHNVLVQGNHLYNIGNANNWGEAIDIKVQVYNITVVDNLIENVRVNSQGGITVLVNDALYPSGQTNPNILISRNVIRDVRRRSGGWNGSGISAGSNGVTITNNLIWDTDEASITATKNASNTTGGFNVYNNTLWDGALINQSSIGSADKPVDADLKNNLIRGGGVTQDDRSAGTEDFIGPLSGEAIAAGFAFTGSGFQLKETSPAVGSGAVLLQLSDDLLGQSRPSSGYSYGALEAIAVTEEEEPVTSDSYELKYAINCGGAGYLASDGIQYSADSYYNGGVSGSKTDAVAGTADDPLYQVYRYSYTEYGFPVENGEYRITFKLVESYWASDESRVFDIVVENEVRVSNLDLHKVAGHDYAYDITLNATVADEQLDISNPALLDNGTIAAILIERIESGSNDRGLPDGDSSDSDGDGLVDLLEEALMLDPLDPSDASGNTPKAQIVESNGEQYIEFTFRRIAGGSGDIADGYTASGIHYIVECNESMSGDWLTGSGLLQQVDTPIDNGDGSETVTVRVNASIREKPAMFLRLNVSRV